MSSFRSSVTGCVLARHMICAAGRYMRDLVCAVCVLVLSWFFSLLMVLLVAWLVTLMGRSMFWYSNLYAAVYLYGPAAVGVLLLIHTLVKNRCYRVSDGQNTTHFTDTQTHLSSRRMKSQI